MLVLLQTPKPDQAGRKYRVNLDGHKNNSLPCVFDQADTGVIYRRP